MFRHSIERSPPQPGHERALLGFHPGSHLTPPGNTNRYRLNLAQMTLYKTQRKKQATASTPPTTAVSSKIIGQPPQGLKGGEAMSPQPTRLPTNEPAPWHGYHRVQKSPARCRQAAQAPADPADPRPSEPDGYRDSETLPIAAPHPHAEPQAGIQMPTHHQRDCPGQIPVGLLQMYAEHLAPPETKDIIAIPAIG